MAERRGGGEREGGGGGEGGGEPVSLNFLPEQSHVQSPMHGVHTSQSEKNTSVPCCPYLSEDTNALAYISTW